MNPITLRAFQDELVKIAYGFEPNPHGGFLLGSGGDAPIPLSRRPAAISNQAYVGKEKDSEGSALEFTYNPGDFAPANLNRKPKLASALTPAGRLASTRQVGTAADSLAHKGVSIAQASKPRGFGHALPFTTKL